MLLLLTFLSLGIIFMLIISPLLALRSSGWVAIWARLEVGIIGLVPLIFIWGGLFLRGERCIKYFVVQAFASGLLLFTGLLIFSEPPTYRTGLEVMMVIFLASLLLKIGVFPFHFWVVPVISFIGDLQILYILGPMKVVPLKLTSLVVDLYGGVELVMVVLSVCSMVIGSVIGNRCYSVRGILGASSISHSGWLLISCIYGCLWIYFILYVFSLRQFVVSHLWGYRFLCGLSILRISGLPPFVLFYAKISLLMRILTRGVYLVLFIGVILRLVISLNFYLKYFFLFSLASPTPNVNQYPKGSVILFVFSYCLLGSALTFYSFFYGWVKLQIFDLPTGYLISLCVDYAQQIIKILVPYT